MSETKVSLEGEIWKDILGYIGEYKISTLGRVWSCKHQRLLISNANTGRYRNVSLNQKTTLIHRLVAQAFLPNPDNKPEVNHINFDSKDNRAANLEWCTPLENIQHSKMAGRMTLPPRATDGKTGELSKLSIAIYQFDLHGNQIKKFIGVNQASKDLGVSRHTLEYSAKTGRPAKQLACYFSYSEMLIKKERKVRQAYTRRADGTFGS